MACDMKPARKRLNESMAALAVAVGNIGLAMLLNGSIFGAAASPGLLAAAAGAAAFSSWWLYEAADKMLTFFDCLRNQPLPPPKPGPGHPSTPFQQPNRLLLCNSEFSAWYTVTQMVAFFIGALAVPCLIVAVFAWIPYVAFYGISLILVDAVFLAGFLVAFTATFVRLQACLPTIPRP